jgi:hypothetical protein
LLDIAGGALPFGRQPVDARCRRLTTHRRVEFGEQGDLVGLDLRAALEQGLQLRFVDDDLAARQQQHAHRIAHAEQQRLTEHDAILDR